MITNEEFKKFKEDYNAGKKKISIKLDKSREFLMSIYYKPLIIIILLIYLLLIVSCVYSFFAIKWFGILYTVIFPLTWFSFMGTCSLPKEQTHNNRVLYLGLIITLFLGIIVGLKVTILFLLTTGTLYLTYYMYQFSAKVVINKFILKDVVTYNFLYGYVFFINN